MSETALGEVLDQLTTRQQQFDAAIEDMPVTPLPSDQEREAARHEADALKRVIHDAQGDVLYDETDQGRLVITNGPQGQLVVERVYRRDIESGRFNMVTMQYLFREQPLLQVEESMLRSTGDTNVHMGPAVLTKKEASGEDMRALGEVVKRSTPLVHV